MRVLGIETSCDETGVAVYDTDAGLLAHRLHSQVDLHARYGGVVPELASRDHIRRLVPLIEEVAAEAGTRLADLDGIAYTQGPGLAGALLVGASVANALGLALGKPVVGIHHLEGHLLSPLLAEPRPDFPFVALLVSGGHTQLYEVAGVGRYTLIGDTLDDAAGEAFDKTAKLLGLGFPGGPAIERAAAQGNPKRHRFPRPLVDADGFDFSFSGLKTAVRRTVETAGELTPNAVADLAASFQAAAIDVLVSRTTKAMEHVAREAPEPHRLVVAGGVAANKSLSISLATAAKHSGFEMFIPAPSLCTDNAAMIAWAGLEHFAMGARDGLDAAPRARWPLDASRRNVAGAKS